MKKNVLISGGSGFIGKQLTNMLIANGYSVSILSRSSKQNSVDISYYQWDVTNQTIDEESVLKADFIIHLAGENIADKKWTKERKEAIVQSREKSIQLIYDVLKKNHKKIDAFVSASGMGIYGAIYAIRKTAITKVPRDYSVDDFFITMNVLRNKGKVIVRKTVNFDAESVIAAFSSKGLTVSSANFKFLTI